MRFISVLKQILHDVERFEFLIRRTSHTLAVLSMSAHECAYPIFCTGTVEILKAWNGRPVWRDGDYHREQLLRQCYERGLRLAAENPCESIAFPLLSAGNHGFPKPLAAHSATSSWTTRCRSIGWCLAGTPSSCPKSFSLGSELYRRKLYTEQDPGRI